jgi:hypothetical protein
MHIRSVRRLALQVAQKHGVDTGCGPRARTMKHLPPLHSGTFQNGTPIKSIPHSACPRPFCWGLHGCDRITPAVYNASALLQDCKSGWASADRLHSESCPTSSAFAKVMHFCGLLMNVNTVLQWGFADQTCLCNRGWERKRCPSLDVLYYWVVPYVVVSAGSHNE